MMICVCVCVVCTVVVWGELICVVVIIVMRIYIHEKKNHRIYIITYV